AARDGTELERPAPPFNGSLPASSPRHPPHPTAMNRYRTRLAALPLALLLLLSLPQTGCGTSRTAQGAVIGAGTGAVVGGVIGRATGSTARGAIIGAAVGGTAGAIIGRQMDQQAQGLDDELENATVETVTDPETGETAGIAVRFDNALLFDLNSSN